MSNSTELNKIISNMVSPDFTKLNQAVNQLGEAMAKAFVPFAEAINQAFDNLSPDVYHEMGTLHPREILNNYYRDEAEPADVVQYILQQPNYTWMGVTIYPDEAWRYECKSDWMWWRER